jgi:tetratricopeptide (TPR) repeat protein
MAENQIPARAAAPSPADSEALYRRLLALNPRDQGALGGLTNALRMQGRFGEALALLESARGQIKLEPALEVLFAEFKLIGGDVPTAMQAFRDAIRRDPNSARAHVGLGRALVLKKDLDAAAESFRTALRADANSVDAHAALAELALARNDVDSAARHGQAAAQANPRHPLGQSAYGMALARQGHIDFAIQCFKNAIECDPNFHPARQTLGELLLRRGEIDAAGQLFGQLIQALPNWSPPRHGMARAALLAGQPQTTETLLADILKREPKRIDIRLEYVQALMLQRKLDDAESALTEILTLVPNLLEAELMRADCVRLRGEPTAAEASYRRLTESHPTRSEPHLSLAMLLEESAEFTRLEAAAQAGLTVAPNNAVLRLALGRALLKRGAAEQALHELKLIAPEALDGARQIRLLRALGRAYEGISDADAAHKAYLQARHLSGDADAALAEIDTVDQNAPTTAESTEPQLGFLLGLPGSGVDVVGRVLKAIDESLVRDDRLSTTVGRQDVFTDAIANVRVPLSADAAIAERVRYQAELGKLPSQHDGALDWIPGAAQSLALIDALYANARVVLVERDLADCVAEVIASGALVQTAPFDPLKLATALKRSHDGIKSLKARFGKRLFSLNANSFIDHPEATIAALSRFLGTPIAVPDWFQQQRTGDPWGSLRPAGSAHSLKAAWPAEVRDLLGLAS